MEYTTFALGLIKYIAEIATVAKSLPRSLRMSYE